jgi:hypothetical protein
VKSRAAIAVLFVLALGTAVIAGIAVRSSTVAKEPASVAVAPQDERIALAEYDARLRRLDQALEQERGRRVALEAQVAELRRKVDERPAVAPVRDDRRERRAKSDDAEPGKEGEKRRAGGLDVDALIEAGFPVAKVRDFKAKLDQVELDRLYLRDVAAREGWLDTPRFREEDLDLGDVVRQARDEMGDEFYDWTLYASGQPNRVRVGDVLDGSAAASAGLRAGDFILSYDDQRIFNPGELRDSTTTGTAGDTTEVWVMRGGQQMQVFVPRGPLGVRVDSATERPPRAG